MRTAPLAALVLICCSAVSFAQGEDPARVPVDQLDAGLLAIMKAGKAAGTGARAARISPVIDRVFDLPLTTRLSVGAAWTGFSAGDQAALVAAVRRLTIAQYASNFDGWNGETFTVAPQVESRGGDRLVRTTLASRGAAPVAISYRLRQSADGWRVVDVFYKNAISQLATRRSDFAAVMASGGAKALIAHLNDLAAKAGG
ncbi:ABC transporter substrate-binding protein [Sphingomonas bacterium]|uniref:ABC transporter substrate-binding protein n=1 Tax=Sphingomonas bacterium TaxID=1895847 RepID=UPI001576897A|nr:ABC transporter substrate-binding protein [Sphingomonas bacterium]